MLNYKLRSMKLVSLFLKGTKQMKRHLIHTGTEIQWRIYYDGNDAQASGPPP